MNIARYKLSLQKLEVWPESGGETIPLVMESPDDNKVSSSDHQQPLNDSEDLGTKDHDSHEFVLQNKKPKEAFHPKEKTQHNNITSTGNVDSLNKFSSTLFNTENSNGPTHAKDESSDNSSPNSSKVDPTKPIDDLLDPISVAVAYLLSPYSILSCLAKSTLLFNSLAIILGIDFAIKG